MAQTKKKRKKKMSAQSIEYKLRVLAETNEILTNFQDKYRKSALLNGRKKDGFVGATAPQILATDKELQVFLKKAEENKND